MTIASVAVGDEIPAALFNEVVTQLNGAQSGLVNNASPPAGGSNGTIYYTAPMSVTFPVPYESTPCVTITEDAGGSLKWATLTGVTSTGFTYRTYQAGAAPATSEIFWRASNLGS